MTRRPRIGVSVSVRRRASGWRRNWPASQVIEGAVAGDAEYRTVRVQWQHGYRFYLRSQFRLLSKACE